MIHIAHIITSLDRGGAETNMAQLVVRMDRRHFRNTVIVLTARGPLAEPIDAAGISIHYLNMRRGFPNPLGLLRLVLLLRKLQPDVIQTWLYHADLLGLIAAGLAGNPPVAWNLRCSNMDFSQYGPLTRWTVKILSKFSGLPKAVVSNSQSGLQQHTVLGYRPRRWELIPNGFDCEHLHPDTEARRRLCREFGFEESTILIGHVARFDPMKDHKGFLSAARRILDARPEARFIVVGKNTERLSDLVAARNLTAATRLLGERGDMATLMPGFDLLCLSSAFGEGFPTVLGEAMACGVPCLSTDVGDAAKIIGDCGRIVPASDPAALAQAVIEMIGSGQLDELGRASRQRIADLYSMPRIVGQYENLYQELTRPWSHARI